MSNKTAKNSKKGKPITSVADAPSHNPLLDDFGTYCWLHVYSVSISTSVSLQ